MTEQERNDWAALRSLAQQLAEQVIEAQVLPGPWSSARQESP
jgi:hypothetical protein